MELRAVASQTVLFALSPVLARGHRQESVSLLRRGTKPLIGQGVYRCHSVSRGLLDFIGDCGMPVFSVTGGDKSDIDCRVCKGLLRKAGI